MNREMVKLIIGTGSGILIGGFVGYVVTQRVLSAKYESKLDEEVARIKAFYQSKRKDAAIEEFEFKSTREEYTPEEIDELSEEELEVYREELQRDLVSKGRNSKIVQKLGYSETPDASEVRPDVEDRKMTIDEEQEIDEDDELLQEMRLARTNTSPFVITIDEFMEDDPEYEKVSVTYFDGDQILSDSQDKVIPEVEEIIGHDALTKFGLFSKDKNIVYVRNERIKTDFEVALDQRSFTEAIAGFREPKVIKKMREDD